MKHTIISYLEQLELLPLEIKIYLTLLETGSMTAREITRKLGINRTSVYPPIDSLIEKELVMKMVVDSETKFAVNEPKDSLPALLERLVKKKLDKLKNLQEEFPTVVKVVERSYAKKTEIDEATIKYYKGKDSVKKIYKEALKAKELRLYVNLADTETLFADDNNIFENAFAQNPGLKIYELIADSPDDVKHIDLPLQKGRYFYKFIPTEVGLTAADILIYDNKVAIINVRDKISGIVLSNKDYYTNSKKLFDFNWKMLPDVQSS